MMLKVFKYPFRDSIQSSQMEYMQSKECTLHDAVIQIFYSCMFDAFAETFSVFSRGYLSNIDIPICVLSTYYRHVSNKQSHEG